MDMHEALLTKADVQGNTDYIDPRVNSLPEEERKHHLRFCDLINHPCNCVLRHHSVKGCWHTPGHGGQAVFQRCARQLATYEGYGAVLTYLTAVQRFYPEVASLAIQRFEAIPF